MTSSPKTWLNAFIGLLVVCVVALSSTKCKYDFSSSVKFIEKWRQNQYHLTSGNFCSMKKHGPCNPSCTNYALNHATALCEQHTSMYFLCFSIYYFGCFNHALFDSIINSGSEIPLNMISETTYSTQWLSKQIAMYDYGFARPII